MRILLDECAPRPLKHELADYEVYTEVGWVEHSETQQPQALCWVSFLNPA